MWATSDRSRTRRERTFIGSECAACEEPLEHTLSGERVLQFSCQHVAHEACFYELIKEFESQNCPKCDAPLHLDTSRGGNVIDLAKISDLVKSASMSEARSNHAVPNGWGEPEIPSRSRGLHSKPASNEYENTAYGLYREARDGLMMERYDMSSRHGRSDSVTTGGFASSPNCYDETAQSSPQRRHDYDVQAMESSLVSPQGMTKSPVPAPTVTVRSEYPTISRSRQQQTLACLVTVEVPPCAWRPESEENTVVASSTRSRRPTMDSSHSRRPSSAWNAARNSFPEESAESLAEVADSLRRRVDNWHGLDPTLFGNLRLHGTLRVGKDKVSWQELECYQFAEMLICVKEKKMANPPPLPWNNGAAPRKSSRCTLKGSILIKRHLIEVAETGTIEEPILTLSLSVAELPQFHLRFNTRNQLKRWQRALLELTGAGASAQVSPDFIKRVEEEEPEEDEWQVPPSRRPQRSSSLASSNWGGAKSVTTAPTEYTSAAKPSLPPSFHVPIDVVVVVPITASMQGVKINLVKDALRFMVDSLGERDRMGLVTFGSSGGGVPIVGMTTKAWPGWSNVLNSIKPVGQKSHRADVVEGANVAMDLLMGRKYNNPVATIMLISDASSSDADSVEFVISRAEAAKIAIHSFGLGMTHKPEMMIELSTRTKASYTYIKDWMMLRECLAGCLGAMQSLSHQNVKVRLKLPEGSPARFHKISGALQVTKRATGRDAEASLGDLRFGDKRDILVQLVVLPDVAPQEHLYQDPWETIVSGLEALGGSVDQEDNRTESVEEAPLLQAELAWGDFLREGSIRHNRPSLLAITLLPSTNGHKKPWGAAPPIPPHPSIVQRRMELLTSDMLTRALTLVSRAQHDRAHTLLYETRSIMKGLGKGGLPPLPPTPQHRNRSTDSSPTTMAPLTERRLSPSPSIATTSMSSIHARQSPEALNSSSMGIAVGIDPVTVAALDAELESSLEWINHPAIFGRDSRKAVLQAIGIISSQRAFTFRTAVEGLWASRISGVVRLTEKSREWHEDSYGDGGILEEA